jgi:3-oxoisoapionate decarboxylase
MGGAIAAATAALLPAVGKADTARSKMGIATTSYMGVRRFRDTYEFLEHCHSLGAAGIQSAINGDLPKIRAQAEQWNMYIESIVPMPKSSDLSGFEQALKDSQAVGSRLVRVNAGGRRYEDFSTLADYQAFAERSQARIKAVIPLCEKYKIPFALENHKDWTLDQSVSIMKTYAGDYFGACLDFGNNIALLENPMEVAEQLAPYTITTHVKDMGVEPYEQGFLLSEVPLGQGFLDLPRMISLVKQSHSKVNLNLEMITRDPLKVPCLTDRYWATFPDRSGLYLARTLRLVHEKGGKVLPRISQLSHQEQLDVEENNVKACLSYANEKLSV